MIFADQQLAFADQQNRFADQQIPIDDLQMRFEGRQKPNQIVYCQFSIGKDEKQICT
jgi:hypothetical protein